MIKLSIIVILSAGISNAVMDWIQFRWRGSYLERRSRRPDKLGHWLAGWVSPEAWKNKHKFKGALRLLMSTWLVFLTDLWHFSQWLMFTALEVNIALWSGLRITGSLWLDLLILVLAMKSIRGVCFELVFSFRNYTNTMRNFVIRFQTLIKNKGVMMGRLALLFGFLISLAIGLGLEGYISDGARSFGALAAVAAGLIAFVLISIYANSDNAPNS